MAAGYRFNGKAASWAAFLISERDRSRRRSRTHRNVLNAKGAKEDAKSAKASEPVDHSDDAVAHMRHIKIQQVAELEVAEAEIAEKLTAMYWQNGFNSLQFDGHQVLDDKIYAITLINDHLFISNWDNHLLSNVQREFAQFVREAGLVRALQQPRTDHRMDLYGGADYRMPDFLLGHYRVLCVSLASFALKARFRLSRLKPR